LVATLAGRLGVAAAAFACGLVATWLAWALGARRGGMPTLLLAGIAVNATAGALTGCVVFVADETQLRDVTFWTLGSLGGADWLRVAITAPLVLGPVMWLPRAGRALNALALGEHEAGYLGFRTALLKRQLIVACALAVGAAVAVSGVVGFVGLIVPHLLRLALGPDHRLLLPAAALGGATLVVSADALARVVVAPAELPIGVLTSLVGGPFFMWLLLRRRGAEVE
jgi:iron complex transport system permease protein